MSGKFFMVYFWRSGQRPELVPGGLPVVYYDCGIPVGTQCFKLAALSFFPFGKEVRYGGGAGSFLLNILG